MPLLYLLARSYLGHRAALAGAGIGLYSFALYVLAISPLTEGIYQAGLLGVLLAWTRWFPSPLGRTDKPPPRFAYPALGCALGLLTLTRAETLLLAGALAALTAWGTSRPNRSTVFGRLGPDAGARPHPGALDSA